MIALVTCAEAVEVDTDLPLLVAELPEARVVNWDDDTVDWSAFRRVVIRSPWDYHRDRDRFLDWARAVAAVTDLWNPVDVIVWNTDKRYLGELAARGVPVVPTTFAPDAAHVDALAASGAFAGSIVVKPTVGASASGVMATYGDEAAGVRHAHRLLASGLTPMLQPYLSGVEDRGETGLVYLGGVFSHAFRRRVVLRPAAELDGDVFGEETSGTRVATAEERAVGDAAMATLPPTAYARIDLLPTLDGPVVLEVEVTEPSLFLHLDQAAPARAAAAFRNL